MIYRSAMVVISLTIPAFAQPADDTGNVEHSLILNPPQQSNDAATDREVQPAEYRAPSEGNFPSEGNLPSRDRPSEESLPSPRPNRDGNATNTPQRIETGTLRRPADATDVRTQRSYGRELRSVLTSDSRLQSNENPIYRRDQAPPVNRREMQSDFGATFDADSRSGAIVNYVERNSPADYAGLRAADLIISINGERVSTGRDAIQILESLPTADRLDVEFFRHNYAQVALGDSDPRANRGYGYTDDRPREDNPPYRTSSLSDPTRQPNYNRNRDDRRTDNRDPRDVRSRIRGLLPRLRD
jgi:hypothetical protein